MGVSDIGVGELGLFQGFHDRRLQAAWECERWPDVCAIEQRTFRASWDGTVTYNAGDQVFDPASYNYYQSLVTANLANPPTIAGAENSAFWALLASSYAVQTWMPDTAYAVGQQVQDPTSGNDYQCITPHTSGSSFETSEWGLLTEFNRYVDWEQAWAAPVGEFLVANDRDPRVTTKIVELPFWLSADGAQFTQMRKAMGWVWLTYRRRRPFLVPSPVWDAAAAYLAGSQVYYVSARTGIGNCFTSTVATLPGQSPDTVPTAWSVIAIPYIFRQYLIQSGFADWLMADGQEDKAVTAESAALTLLELEADKFHRQQGQGGRVRYQGV
nr:hypothetical protein [uncultured Rhodopila sp.]